MNERTENHLYTRSSSGFFDGNNIVTWSTAITISHQASGGLNPFFANIPPPHQTAHDIKSETNAPIVLVIGLVILCIWTISCAMMLALVKAEPTIIALFVSFAGGCVALAVGQVMGKIKPLSKAVTFIHAFKALVS